MNDLLVDPKEEQVIFSSRKHFFNVLPALAAAAILGVMGAVGLPAVWVASADLKQYLAGPALSVLMAVIVSLGLLMATTAYWVYAQNRLVLTNLYVMQVTQNGLFNRIVSRISLDKLQEVTARQRGPIAQIFGFGDLIIETAGEQENFVFRQIPNPQAAAHRIMQAHESLEDRPKPVTSVRA